MLGWSWNVNLEEVLALTAKVNLWTHLLCVAHWIVIGIRHVKLALTKASVLASSRESLLGSLRPVAWLVRGQRLFSLFARVLRLRELWSRRKSIVLRRINSFETILGEWIDLLWSCVALWWHRLVRLIVSTRTYIILTFFTGRSYHVYWPCPLLVFHAVCLVQISISFLLISTDRCFTRGSLHHGGWIDELRR